MIDGPLSAPSSPPEMPQPTKWMPFSRAAFSRRMVSWNRALPPSMRMSPGSSNAESSSMTASVGPPALTMMMILRGTASDATNSAADSLGTNVPSEPCSSITARVLLLERLWMAVTKPLLAKLRARLEPITAIPVTPISAVPTVESVICGSLPVRGGRPPGVGRRGGDRERAWAVAVSVAARP